MYMKKGETKKKTKNKKCGQNMDSLIWPCSKIMLYFIGLKKVSKNDFPNKYFCLVLQKKKKKKIYIYIYI